MLRHPNHIACNEAFKAMSVKQLLGTKSMFNHMSYGILNKRLSICSQYIISQIKINRFSSQDFCSIMAQCFPKTVHYCSKADGNHLRSRHRFAG